MGITVVGSLSENIAFDNVRMNLMMRDCTNASLDKLEELVKKYTPVGEDNTRGGPKHAPGHLRDSMKKKGPRRVAKNTWQGEVFTDVEYAAAIEYGMPRKPITAASGGKLAFIGSSGELVVVPAAPNWGGYDGAHMFQKADAEFERAWSERIARAKAVKWLGASSSAGSVVTI